DPSDEQVLPRASANRSIAFTFSEKMNVTRPQQAVASFLRLGRRNLPDDAQPPAVPFVASWDGEGRVLTVDPVQDLLPGYRYQVTLANAELKDLSGVQRSGFISGTNPAQADALRLRGGSEDLSFAVSADAAELVVTGLGQEPDTADNVAAGSMVRAWTLEERADASERSFHVRYDAGDYLTRRTDCAYIQWTPPTDPVARYRVWTRASPTATPILLSNPSNPYNIARPSPLAASAAGYDICLDDLDDVLSNDPAGLPGQGLANVTWNNGLQAELGVSVVNLDGQEGPITWTTVKDNTAPAISMGTALGFDYTFNSFSTAADSIRLQDNLACLGPTPSRIMCPGVPSSSFAGQVATGFGQRMLLLELTEPVDPASVTQANFKLSTGTLPTRLTVVDPNTAGGSTEPDATLSGAVALDVQNGRTKFVAVRLDNVFGVDTGDVLALRASDAAGVKDLAGNVAKDDVVSRAVLVDNTSPQIKSVSYDPATESMTLVLTKRIDPVKDADATRGNFDRNKVAFDTNFFDLNRAKLQTVNHSYTAAGDSQLVFQFADLGYVRGYNSSNASCSANGGTRIRLNGVQNVDVVSSNGGAGATNGSDTGTEAYVNLPVDPTAVHAPGAYMPGANGVGTHSSFADTIGPRLSSDFADRTLSTANNDFFVFGSAQSNRSITVTLTEAVESSAATDVGNWTLKLVDLGNDGWTGNLGTDAAAGNATVTITSVTLQNTLTTCATPPRYQVTFRIDNADAGGRTFGVGTVSLSPTVKDLAGNAGSTRLGYTYNPGRLDAAGNTSPGWDRT
ncbi:MAG: Ig-like domain-containing protein, partial [Deltaproteobacteria bacterium]|nr:Ig-like domain-containing protein [Deltaproteobacteria bacterium]